MRQRRTRRACRPCHTRKRKCDGSEPCSTCQRDGYECHFRTSAVTQPPITEASRSEKQTSTTQLAHETRQYSTKANSGQHFLRQLFAKIDPSNSSRKQPVAWNVGANTVTTVDPSRPAYCIVDVLSYVQMSTLASIYFSKIHPCYGFVERGRVLRQIDNRWLQQSSIETCDATLCGIAALGSYFSKAFAVPNELQLVQLAKSILDSSSPHILPDLEAATAWICHVIYLRLTSAPLPAWLASCTAMHILEAVNIHANGSFHEDSIHQTSSSYSPKTLQRAFGVAQHLNTWISYDLSLTPIHLQGPPKVTDVSTATDFTEKLLELLPYSLDMNSAANQDDKFLRSTLYMITAKTDCQPPLIMAQCNLLLCILRQLCDRNALRTIGEQASDITLRFLAKGVKAALQMIEDDCPWHHLVNVPFQTLCMLLTIDTPASLKMAGDAIETLQRAAQAYDTIASRDAFHTAVLLLSMHRKRRLEDAQHIDETLSRLFSDDTMALSAPIDSSEWSVPDEAETIWLRDLMNDFPSLQHINVGDYLGQHASGQFQGVDI